MKKDIKEYLNDTKDNTGKYTKKEIEAGKPMAILSYIIPLIPYIVEKDNKFAMFHAKEALNLFIISLIYGVISSCLSNIFIIRWIVSIPLAIICILLGIIDIIGLINAINGKAKELPVINKFKIIK